MIKIIGKRTTLISALVNKDESIFSYVNLNNYQSLLIRDDLSNICFTVDSSLLARFLGCTALMPDLSGYIADAISMSSNVLCIGGNVAESEAFRSAMVLKFPNVAFNVLDGYKHDEFYIESFMTLRPDLVICSMGFPRQEELALGLKDIKGDSFNSLFICSGAFMSQTARNSNGYPRFIIKLNIRWLYRLLHEKSARSRFIKILINYFELYGKKGSSFRHSVRLQ